MVKVKGLGKGLDALLGGDDDGDQAVDERGLQDVSVYKLKPGKYQPRQAVDQESLAELANSIKSQGLIQPILVRPISVDEYEIIAGERRWRAAKLAGLAEVPVVVREVSDKSALAMALIENLQREDLNVLEEATGIQRLINEFEMTHEAAADAVGRSRSAVTNLLRLLNLAAPVQELIRQGKLEMGHGRALLALNTAKQLEIAQTIIKDQLSVRETERLVGQALQQIPATKPKPSVDNDVFRLQEEIAERLGTKVTIKSQDKGRGKLIIEYHSLDQLDDILQRLEVSPA